jgi:hypothetical protein
MLVTWPGGHLLDVEALQDRVIDRLGRVRIDNDTEVAISTVV